MTSAESLDSGPSGLPDLPDGTLLRSRVESDPADPLVTALDRELTGYAVFEPQGSLLLDADGVGVVGFEDGVPRFAYHTGTDRGGPEALADLAAPGPYDVELRDADGALSEFARSDRRVPPGLVADRLAGDSTLAERTREAAPPEWSDDGEDGREAGSMDAVEAFLDDGEKIAAIRDRAREEAKERAEQWGLDGELE
ncbi:hypothetical protein [Halorussus salinisoli]|uniref:hypothetical protein n=1 Tax=Halorussus salinisoli TaxID=2558242 RepID=UPI0010C1998D|nr:hypothetical protein [Halorussus salinisoli]